MIPFAPLFIHIMVASVGIVAAIRANPVRHALLLAYLSFVAFAGIAGGIVFHFMPSHYRSAFWALEFTHNLLLCALALKLISNVLPRRFATMWALFFLTSLLFSITRQWPVMSTSALLNISISMLAVAGILLVALAFVTEIEWRPGYVLFVIGLAVVLMGNLMPSIEWISGTVAPLALQLGDVPGLLILAVIPFIRVSSKIWGRPYHRPL